MYQVKKLSTAIRRGSKGASQATGYLMNRETGARCVLGAGLVGIGRSDLATDEKGYNLLRKVFPILRRKVENPVTGSTGRLDDVLILLNDDAHWSFNHLIEFVKGLERASSRK